MFDFLSAPEPEESDPNANDVAVQSAEASTSTIPAEETTPVASDEVEERSDEAAKRADEAGDADKTHEADEEGKGSASDSKASKDPR